jgi:hypothetical protein
MGLKNNSLKKAYNMFVLRKKYAYSNFFKEVLIFFIYMIIYLEILTCVLQKSMHHNHISELNPMIDEEYKLTPLKASHVSSRKFCQPCHILSWIL